MDQLLRKERAFICEFGQQGDRRRGSNLPPRSRSGRGFKGFQHQIALDSGSFAYGGKGPGVEVLILVYPRVNSVSGLLGNRVGPV